MDELATASQLACGNGVERRRDRGGEGEGPVAREAAPGGLRLARQASEHFRLGCRPDTGGVTQATGFRCRAQLVRGPDPQRPTEGHEPLRPEPEVAAERDELRLDLALELLELGDPAGLDELAQPLLDAWPNAAQLANAARADELCHRSRCPTDEIRGAVVGAHAPVGGASEVEEGSVGVKRAGDLGVVHGASVSPWSLS